LNQSKQVRQEIYRLIIPVVLENMLQTLAGLVITAMAGRLLASDIAAQGISMRVTNLCWALFKGLGIGCSVIVALHYGAGRLDKCRRVIEQTYLTALPIALIFTVVIFLWPQVVVGFFTEEQALVAKAMEYLRIAVWSVPFNAMVMINAAAFNGRGNTRTPMYIAISLNIVNVIAGYIGIFGLFGIGGWGITGAAVATVIAQAFGCGMGLYILYRRKGFFHDSYHGLPFFRMDGSCLREAYAASLPAALEQVCWHISAILMSKIILSYGSDAYAAYQLGLQAEMITEMPAMGFTIAATTLAARAVGRRDGDLLRSYTREIRRVALFTGAAAAAALFLLPDVFMRMLTDKVVLQQIGGSYVCLMGFSQIPQILSKVYNGFIRSSGNKKIPMYISFFGIWCFRMPVVFVIGWLLHVDITWIWIVISADQILRMVLSTLYYKKKDLAHAVEHLEEKEMQI